jgi:hypothetical protein
VNGTRATLAIVRREMDSPWLARLCVGLIAGFGLGILSSPSGAFEDHLTAALAALWFAVGGTLRVDVRDGMYFAAPLYGRQLARAHALVALAGAFALPLGATLGWALRGAPGNELAPGGFAVTLFCAAALSAVVALSATPRCGGARAVYALLAVGAGAVTLIPYVTGLRDAPFAGLAAALLLGFFGLRAFGETLARYDPIG